MPEQELPDCPYCHNHDRVEKVSSLVERAFPMPPGDYANIVKEYRMIKWGGKGYFVKKRYFQLKQGSPKPFPKWQGLFFLLFFAKTSSIMYLVNTLTKYLSTIQIYSFESVPDDPAEPNQAAEITGLMLLPVLEKPGLLPSDNSFRRYFWEAVSLLAWRYIAGIFFLAFGFALHFIFLIIIAGAYLFFEVFRAALAAVVLKLFGFWMKKVHSDYKENVRRLPKAYERWQKLYYCHFNDGVFTADGSIKFTHIKRVRTMLFDDEKSFRIAIF